MFRLVLDSCFCVTVAWFWFGMLMVLLWLLVWFWMVIGWYAFCFSFLLVFYSDLASAG